MIDILNRILPNINILGKCNGGSCTNSPLGSIVNAIDPLRNITTSVFPLVSQNKTSSFCNTFSEFFEFPDTNKVISNGEFQDPHIRHALTIDQKTMFTQALGEMDKLISEGHQVLRCLLDTLCECHPNIKVYIRSKDEIDAVGFSYTAYTDPKVQDPSDLDMIFYLDKIDDYAKARAEEYIVRNFMKPPRKIDLCIQNSSASYFPFTPSYDYFIGYIVHELGHVVDVGKGKWRHHFTLKKHTHAFMWEAFYFQEFWVKNNYTGFPSFSGKQDFLNLPPSPFNCTDILNKIDRYDENYGYPEWP